MPRRAKHSITFYALHESIQRPEDAIRGGKHVEHQSIPLGKSTGHLYIVPAQSTTPRWARILEGTIDLERMGIRSSSAYGVLLVETKHRMFALTLGNGRHLLRNDIVEERFGLKATLNAIDPDSIRGLDRKSFETLSRQVHEQATRPANVSAFGLDIEQDVLRAVVGTPRDPTLAARLYGKDSLIAVIDRGLEHIVGFVERCDALSREVSYKEDYPWVDNIEQISNKTKINELDGVLLDRIKAHELDGLWLALPEPIDWAQADGFKFSKSAKLEVAPDLRLSDFLGTVRDPTALTTKALKEKRAYYYVHDRQDPADSWPVYKCICFEVSSDESTFLLSGGKWYRLQQDFVERVNRYVRRIPTSSLCLPECQETDEHAYNQRICRDDPALTFMDRRLAMHGGGRSRIEICDVLTKDRQLVHVKRYEDAQGLSHLFSQASVSAELLLVDEAFRRKANEKLIEAGAAKARRFPIKSFDAKQYEVIFCIIVQSPDDVELPFFSRVNLRAATRRLTKFGYKVTTLFVRGPRS